jgi:hypothetical protein
MLMVTNAKRSTHSVWRHSKQRLVRADPRIPTRSGLVP